MYCTNCGKKLEEKDKFCPECGKVVSEKEEVKAEKVNNTGEKQYVKNMRNDTFLCIISLVLMYGMPIIVSIALLIASALPFLSGIAGLLTLLAGFAPIAALVLAIYTKVHYPESKFAKTLIIIYVIQIVIEIIIGIIALVACIELFKDCGDLGMILPLIIK